MKLHTFPSYDVYLQTQVRGSHYRTNRRPSANLTEIGRIVEYASSNGRQMANGICHGARCGTEVKLFREALPEAAVLGTDLYAKNPELVIEWDFHKTKPEWVEAFDFVYSNALDHSPTPLGCLKEWVSQLKSTGLMFVTWTFAHALEDRPTLPFPGGDCFGAALHEYIRLLQQVGTVHDLLWCNVGHGQVVTVTGRKPTS